MKAVRFSRFGGPEVLEIVDLPDPHPGPGQLRIAVRAAGVNPSDWKKRQGLMDESRLGRARDRVPGHRHGGPAARR
jgi:NADPH:quinone reductase-like Zn-dependent oxidoreductase